MCRVLYVPAVTKAGRQSLFMIWSEREEGRQKMFMLTASNDCEALLATNGSIATLLNI